MKPECVIVKNHSTKYWESVKLPPFRKTAGSIMINLKNSPLSLPSQSRDVIIADVLSVAKDGVIYSDARCVKAFCDQFGSILLHMKVIVFLGGSPF